MILTDNAGSPVPGLVDQQLLRAAPKVALHDHLDGGLRPATIVELAAEIGHRLPRTDPDELGDWFFDAADSGSLERYLQTFVHSVAVLQTAPALRRVAAEFVEDQAADGVIYAEARWAPSQHTAAGLTMRQAVEAVRDGLADGVSRVAQRGSKIIVRQLLAGLRQFDDSAAVAQLVVDYRDDSVVGFDLAGPEAGFPPRHQLAAFETLRRANMRYTIHAGEAAGVSSIWEALQVAGAHRIGHGARLVEDITGDGPDRRLGSLARLVRDLRIPLELCPSSNLQTGLATAIVDHPIDVLVRAGFRVTVNCDNRLMSRTTLSREFALLAEAFGYGLDDIERFTIDAAKSAFLDFDQRTALIEDQIIPGYTALRGS